MRRVSNVRLRLCKLLNIKIIKIKYNKSTCALKRAEPYHRVNRIIKSIAESITKQLPQQSLNNCQRYLPKNNCQESVAKITSNIADCQNRSICIKLS